MSVGDDGQGFHGWWAKALGSPARKKKFHKSGVVRPGMNFPPLGALRRYKGPTGFFIGLVELAKSSDDFFIGDGGKSFEVEFVFWTFGGGRICALLGDGVFGELAGTGTDEAGEFRSGERGLRGNQQRFNNGGKIHGEAGW